MKMGNGDPDRDQGPDPRLEGPKLGPNTAEVLFSLLGTSRTSRLVPLGSNAYVMTQPNP